MVAPLPTDSVDALLAKLPRLAEIAPGCPFAAQLDAGRKLTAERRAEMWAQMRPDDRRSPWNARAAVDSALHWAARARSSARRGSQKNFSYDLRYLQGAVRGAIINVKRAKEPV